MTDTRRPVFNDFPQTEDFWWVRWIDGYLNRFPETNTPCVKILLQRHPLLILQYRSPEGLESVVSDKITDENHRFCYVHSGGIPTIKIGDIYQRGVLMGNLSFQEEEFFVDTTVNEPTLVKVSDKLDPPPGWPESSPYRVINLSEYPLTGMLSSHCVMIEESERTLLFPCQDIFRVFYANNIWLAHALTEGPWGHGKHRLINEKMTARISPDHWQITLRAATPNVCLYTLAYLSADPTAVEAVKKVTFSILPTANRTEKFVQAAIPFPPTNLRLKAKLHPLRKSPSGHVTYLVTSITGFGWPYPEELKIEYRRELDARKGEEEVLYAPSPGDNTTPVITPSEEVGPRRTEIEVRGGPSSNEYAPMDLPLPDLTIFDPPTPILMPKEKSSERKRRRKIPKKLDWDTHGTFADPELDDGIFGGVNVWLIDTWEISTRFEILQTALGKLANTKNIAKWETVRYPASGLQICRGEVWPFLPKPNVIGHPDRHQWAYIDGKIRRTRTAYICRIEVEAGRVVHLLEIECRPKGEGFCAFLFQPKAGDGTACIDSLLKIAQSIKGVWGNAEDDQVNSKSLADMLEKWESRKHVYEKNNDGSGKKKTGGEVIKTDWLLRVLREFLGLHPKKEMVSAG